MIDDQKLWISRGGDLYRRDGERTDTIVQNFLHLTPDELRDALAAWIEHRDSLPDGCKWEDEHRDCIIHRWFIVRCSFTADEHLKNVFVYPSINDKIPADCLSLAAKCCDVLRRKYPVANVAKE